MAYRTRLLIVGLAAILLTGLTSTTASARPDPPVQLQVTPDGAGALRLNWQVPNNPGGGAIDRYQIWRSTQSDPSTFRWYAVTDATTFRDTGLRSGQRYHYYLKAIDSSESVSWRNGIVSAVATGGGDTQRPGIPSGLRASANGTSVQLNWTAATDNVAVARYRVYKATGNGGFSAVAWPSGTSWTDNNVSANTTYRYYLRAVDTAGNVGWRNGIVSATVGGQSASTLWAVGDMAQCWNNNDERVGDLLEAGQGPILALGDVAYPSASTQVLNNCFTPAFGAVKNRMWTVVGNHEYDANDAKDYFNFFGAAAGPWGKGWYEKTVNGWQVLVLNTNCWENGIGCKPGTTQYDWLAERLAARPNACRVVAMHHPRWSSYGTYPDQPFLDPMLNLLHDAGTEIVLAGHAHHYERFAPQNPDQQADWNNGMRMFIVGTGGVNLRSANNPAPHSVVRIDNRHGALKLDLKADSYTWSFLDVSGAQRDSGSSVCRTN